MVLVLQAQYDRFNCILCEIYAHFTCEIKNGEIKRHEINMQKCAVGSLYDKLNIVEPVYDCFVVGVCGGVVISPTNLNKGLFGMITRVEKF